MNKIHSLPIFTVITKSSTTNINKYHLTPQNIIYKVNNYHQTAVKKVFLCYSNTGVCLLLLQLNIVGTVLGSKFIGLTPWILIKTFLCISEMLAAEGVHHYYTESMVGPWPGGGVPLPGACPVRLCRSHYTSLSPGTSEPY